MDYSTFSKGDVRMTAYRIHGDNIVECERIASLIIQTLQQSK
jgi:hypothetical protein